MGPPHCSPPCAGKRGYWLGPNSQVPQLPLPRGLAEHTVNGWASALAFLPGLGSGPAQISLELCRRRGPVHSPPPRLRFGSVFHKERKGDVTPGPFPKVPTLARERPLCVWFHQKGLCLNVKEPEPAQLGKPPVLIPPNQEGFLGGGEGVALLPAGRAICVWCACEVPAELPLLWGQGLAAGSLRKQVPFGAADLEACQVRDVPGCGSCGNIYPQVPQSVSRQTVAPYFWLVPF